MNVMTPSERGKLFGNLCCPIDKTTVCSPFREGKIFFPFSGFWSEYQLSTLTRHFRNEAGDGYSSSALKLQASFPSPYRQGIRNLSVLVETRNESVDVTALGGKHCNKWCRSANMMFLLRLYIKSRNGGRGLLEMESAYNVAVVGISEYI